MNLKEFLKEIAEVDELYAPPEISDPEEGTLWIYKSDRYLSDLFNTVTFVKDARHPEDWESYEKEIYVYGKYEGTYQIVRWESDRNGHRELHHAHVVDGEVVEWQDRQ